MALIYVTQRVDVYPGRNERRDALDQMWHKMLGGLGLRALPVPNDEAQVKLWLKASQPSGILLSGGNTPTAYGGTALERCKTDETLLDFAVRDKIPIMGVCRGMQSIVIFFGGSLKKVDGHIRARHELSGRIVKNVNSFHEYAIDILPEGFSVMASAEDGNIEAIRHKSLPIAGIMWHMEREEIFCEADMKLLAGLFCKQ